MRFAIRLRFLFSYLWLLELLLFLEKKLSELPILANFLLGMFSFVKVVHRSREPC